MTNIKPSKFSRSPARVRRRCQREMASSTLQSQSPPRLTQSDHDMQRGNTKPRKDSDRRLGELIDLHIKDLGEFRKQIMRTKAYSLDKLKRDLGGEKLADLTRQRLIAHGKARAQQGAGPMTVSLDLSFINSVLLHAAAVHGIKVPAEEVAMARSALTRLGLLSGAAERDRRPTQDELDRIISFHDNNPKQRIPMGRIVKFAVATGMRRDEICSILWQDINLATSIAIVRNRKHPRRKLGNHQKVPLLNVVGYDAVALLREQRALGLGSDRVFPYSGCSVGTAFSRGCVALAITDLRFHDLRHEATSRLFEAGFDIPEVSLVTGHKDWKMLRRYLHLQAHHLVGRTPQRRHALN